jgi:hypothetical protein
VVRRIVKAIPEHVETPTTFAAPSDAEQLAARRTAARVSSQAGRITDGIAYCEIAPTHPEAVNPFQIPILNLTTMRGHFSPMLIVSGKLGPTSVRLGPQGRDVAHLTARHVTLSPGDDITLDVVHDASKPIPLGRVSGRYTGESPWSAETDKLRATCRFATTAEWNDLTQRARDVIRADLDAIRKQSPALEWSHQLLGEMPRHVAEYRVFDERASFDDDLNAAVAAWWTEHMAYVDKTANGTPPGQWVRVTDAFDARTVGLGCLTGGRIVPHCEMVVEVRARASVCLPDLRFEAIYDDGDTGAALQDRIEHAGDVSSISLYATQTGIDDKIDLTTATEVPFHVRALRVKGVVLRLY